MLNPGVLYRWASRKEDIPWWYEYSINPINSANPIDFSREHGGSDSLTLLDQNSRVARSFCVKSLLLFLV
jgi:hypothetical protein